MTTKLDGGEAILEAFRDLGVDLILASPGSEWAPVWEALARQKIEGKAGPRYIDCWHETLAVDMAIGYTLVTGRMQPVLLHAGAGLLQGTMGIHAAQLAGVPMLVMSGEALTYGENPGLDPGAQWYRNLSIVGGPHRLVEPIVKWCSQVTSPYTLYETIIRTAEMSVRHPVGPTFLNVPVETMLHEWQPPARRRAIPPAPKVLTPPADIGAVAELLIASDNPVVTTETAGRDPAAFATLVELAELLALPVVESRAAVCANFPKDHPLHQGFAIAPFAKEADLVLLVSSRAPWYPPSSRPPNAAIVAIDETPHRHYMVYQSLQANHYLEGDVAATLSSLAAEIRALGFDDAKVEARRARLAAAHTKRKDADRAAEAKAAGKAPIDPVALCVALRETMPADTVWVDETILHSALLQQHVDWNDPQSYFYVQGGLGQGLGVALGVKLAKPDQPVALMIGDGSFLYNPIIQSLGASRENGLPLLIVVFNNRKYASMKANHLRFYPDGVAVKNDLFHGVNLNGPDFDQFVVHFGGYGEKVTDHDALKPALEKALATVRAGQTAIVNVILAH